MTARYAIGVDLSYTATGIAWPGAVDTFHTKPTDGDLIERGINIAAHVCAHARDAHLIVIEGGVTRSPAAFDSGMLHGVILMSLRATLLPHHHDRIVMVPPAVLKKYMTGKGNADKTAVIIAARERLGYDGMDDNEADALGLRAIGHHLLGDPLCVMPKAHVAVLEKLDYPNGDT